MRDPAGPMSREHLLQHRQIAEVGLDQGITRMIERRRDIAALAGRAVVVVEIIHADHFITPREQRIGKMAADKAGAAGNEIAHCAAPIRFQMTMSCWRAGGWPIFASAVSKPQTAASWMPMLNT